MNYTFFIGNGFDLGMGLKTSYSDFIQYYLTTPALTITLQQSREYLVKHMQSIPSPLWMDLEVALGILTGYYPPTEDGFRDFIELHDDITIKLHDFVVKKNKTFSPGTRATRICRCFQTAITSPFTHLSNIPRNNILSWLQNNKSAENHYAFVSFNFTDVFDRCLSYAYSPSHGARQNPYRLDTILGNNPEVVHIHGNAIAADHNRHLLLGINDISQAVNNFGRPDDLTECLVKPYVNSLLQNGYPQQIANLIENSHFIIVCGSSLGETDKVWWQMIGEWLNFNTNRHLIIHAYLETAIYNQHNCLSMERRMLRKFLSYQDQVFHMNLERRIHVVVNNNGFPTI